MIKLSEVIHLYLGCDAQTNYRTETKEGQAMTKEIGQIRDVDLYLVDQVGVHLNKEPDETHYIQFPVKEIKPILRKISDMSDGERQELFNLVFGRAFPISGGVRFIEDERKPERSRWCLSSGVDRLGIEFSGTVWYDCDLHPYHFNQHQVTLWLLKRKFDLFGLIDSGQATHQKS